MINMSYFRSMVENTNGFFGKEYVDEYPYMGLVECIQASANDCMMSLAENANTIKTENDNIVHNMYRSITEGVEYSQAAINEASKQSLLDRIKAFFTRIKKWVQSIIAKIKLNIDRRTKSGEQLWHRYQNAEGLKNLGSKKLVFNGYEFKNEVPFTVNVNADFVNKNIPKPTPNMAAPKSAEIKKVSDETSDKRQRDVAQAVTGITGLSEGSWKSDLIKKIYGEKKDLQLGKGIFTLNAVKDILLNQKALKEDLSSYEALNKKINDDQESISKAIETIKEGYAEQHDKMAEKNDDKEIKGQSEVIDYINKYFALYTEALGVVQAVKAIATKYHEDRENQAKRMFVMMITGKVEKKNEDFEGTDDLYDFDF